MKHAVVWDVQLLCSLCTPVHCTVCHLSLLSLKNVWTSECSQVVQSVSQSGRSAADAGMQLTAGQASP